MAACQLPSLTACCAVVAAETASCATWRPISVTGTTSRSPTSNVTSPAATDFRLIRRASSACSGCATIANAIAQAMEEMSLHHQQPAGDDGRENRRRSRALVAREPPPVYFFCAALTLALQVAAASVRA